MRRFVVLLGVALMAGLASLTLTPLGGLVIERLYAVDAELGAVVRTALFWLIPFPLLRGLVLFHAGLLLRVRHTERVSYATLSNLGISILSVFGLVMLPWIQQHPIFLPILVTYIGTTTELASSSPAWRSTATRPLRTSPARVRAAGSTLFGVVRFFWPLALIMLIQEVSRPVINLFVARGPDATNALAILAVLYTLGRIPYGWLNDIRSLAPAFRDEANGRRYIKRFTLACGSISLSMMVVLFWTPLRDIILAQWIGVPDASGGTGRRPAASVRGLLVCRDVTGLLSWHRSGRKPHPARLRPAPRPAWPPSSPR